MSKIFQFKVGAILRQAETPQKLAAVSVQIGAVTVYDLAIWRGRSGQLRVLWPTRYASRFEGVRLGVVEVSDELRGQIERVIIAAYRDQSERNGEP